MARKKKIFISYKRNIEPDEPIALELFGYFHKRHDAFIDQSLLVGTKWAESIEKQLRKSDFFVCLISEYSVNSEMVIAEIATAHKLYKQYGRPVILPVRLNFTDPLAYPLNAYLDPINYVLWEKESDTTGLIEQLELSIAGKVISSKKLLNPKNKTKHEIVEPPPSVTPIDLEFPEGSMNPHSYFYVERDGDRIAINTLKKQGITITIKGPRQIGKSSLLNSLVEAAVRNGRQTVFLDFQLIEKEILKNAKSFYQHFCKWISYKLGVKDDVEKIWKTSLSNPQLCSIYMEEKVFAHVGQPLLLAIDEAERVFETKFRSDFFGMLRSWHNNRAYQGQWKSLDIALVTSTEPYQFVEDLNQSPFNVGEIIEVQDFTDKQVVELNNRHGSPLVMSEIEQLMHLLEGHPYLTRKALYLISSKRISATELFLRANDDRGPFGDHLRNNLFRIYDKKPLINGLRLVINHNKCPDMSVFFRLKGAGLVREQDGFILPRNNLYAEYFRKHLNG